LFWQKQATLRGLRRDSFYGNELTNKAARPASRRTNGEPTDGQKIFSPSPENFLPERLAREILKNLLQK